MMKEAIRQAEALSATVAEHAVRIVLAESCTAGLASAMLTRTPGISTWHCGSAVVYQEATKIAWLGVSADDLEKHTAVSEPVARQMATGVLRNTPEAMIAASITGHLGPNAPADQDGLVWISIARRGKQNEVRSVGAWAHHLKSANREDRQWEAAALLLRRLHEAIVPAVA